MTATDEQLTGLGKEVDLLSAETVALRRRIATTWGRVADRLPSGRRLFTQDDGLLLLGADSDIWKVGSAYRWMGSRKEIAAVTGAIHWEPGRWPGTQALVVEENTTNLCDNPSVETNTTNWAGLAGATVTRSSDDAVFGAYSLKVAPTANVWDGCYWGTLAMTGGTTYIASAWVKGEPGVSYYLGLYDTVALAYVGGIRAFTGTGQWQRVVTVAGAAVGNNNAQFWARKSNDASTDVFYVDGVQIEAKAYETTYCDGSLGTGYAWTGAAHGSTSTRAQTEINLDAHANVCSGNNTFSVRLVTQAPHDSTITWSVPTSPFLWTIRGADDNNYAYIRFASGNLYVYINGAYRCTAACSFSKDDWLDIVATLDFTNDEYKLYRDGVLLDTDATVLTAPVVTQMNLGALYSAAYPWGGAFSGFAVFDRVLTSSEISVLYHNQRSLVDEMAFHKPLARGRYYYDVDNSRIYELTPAGLKYIALT